MISRCLFSRGEQKFEVMVTDNWSPENIAAQKQQHPSALPLFLETNDFECGNEAFALDFLLMKQTGELLEGEDILANISLSAPHIRNHLESEIRQLLVHIRQDIFFGRVTSVASLGTLLSGIQTGIQYLGHPFPLCEEEKKKKQQLVKKKYLRKNIYSQKHLITLLEESVSFLEELEKQNKTHT